MHGLVGHASQDLGVSVDVWMDDDVTVSVNGMVRTGGQAAGAECEQLTVATCYVRRTLGECIWVWRPSNAGRSKNREKTIAERKNTMLNKKY